jgi:uncharacterized integral membrane protein (TIGR00697 family)
MRNNSSLVAHLISRVYMNTLLFITHLALITICTSIMVMMGRSALVSWICLQAILANLFVLKQITLFGVNATASDAYIVGSVLSLNLLQEYYGKDEARKTIWISFVLLIFYTFASQVHIFYTPSLADFCQAAYSQLLGFMPRITTASLCTYLIVQYCDTYWYSLLKKFFLSKHVVLRNILSITLSQALDTVLFSILGLWGIMDNLVQVMVVSFSIKIGTMLIMTPLVLWIKQLRGRT